MQTSLAQLSDTDEAGLWAFPDDARCTGSTCPSSRSARRRNEMINRIQQLIPSGGARRYAVTCKAAEQVRKTARADTINAVVVTTDGRSRNPDDIDLDGLIRQLANQAAEGGIWVFTIAYGQDADLDTLKRISEASRAAAYDAADPLTIDTVFTNVLSNF